MLRERKGGKNEKRKKRARERERGPEDPRRFEIYQPMAVRGSYFDPGFSNKLSEIYEVAGKTKNASWMFNDNIEFL